METHRIYRRSKLEFDWIHLPRCKRCNRIDPCQASGVTTDLSTNSSSFKSNTLFFGDCLTKTYTISYMCIHIYLYMCIYVNMYICISVCICTKIGMINIFWRTFYISIYVMCVCVSVVFIAVSLSLLARCRWNTMDSENEKGTQHDPTTKKWTNGI